jgi:oligoendopeptidase F
MKSLQIWDLESLFQGGSSSKAFASFLNALNTDLKALTQKFEFQKNIKDQILTFQTLNERIEEAASFVGCLLAQDVSDTQAELLQSKIEDCKGLLANISNLLDHSLNQLSDQDFLLLLQDKDMKTIVFPLEERRLREKQKLDLKTEALINDLSIDGYHSWPQLYSSILGQEKITIQIEGREETLSWGQAYNRLSSPQRSVRKAVFESSNLVWNKHQSLYGQILNHIAGFRLKVYEHRGWEVLREPLQLNRMSKDTLDVMWKTIDQNKSIFVDYMHSKARLLGLDKLSWYDQDAPLETTENNQSIPYEEAAQFIVDKFAQFSPKMAAYAEQAFTRGWIEAEDRGGKRPGGFCTGLPLNKESRIFMTYSGTNESLFTLAHELGHAFHNHIIYGLPEMARHFPMNLAETASTFAEMVVSEAAFQKETNERQRLSLLNAKLQRSIVFFFNIHARFLFETQFYEERKKGTLSNERLCGLMEQAQKQAYCGSLSEYHPYFWASKMHFNITDIPFYNFPYTFGYLFSTAIYHKAKNDSSFEETYIALLADTGRMSAEDLALKHLNVDLASPAFWQSTIDILKQDAHQFLDMAKRI